MVLGQLDIHILRNEGGPLHFTIWKHGLQVDHRPNARAKTIKILQESTGFNFLDLGLGDGFLGMTSKNRI